MLVLCPSPSAGRRRPGRVAVLDRRKESEGPGLRWLRCSQSRPRFEPKGDVPVHKPQHGPARPSGDSEVAADVRVESRRVQMRRK